MINKRLYFVRHGETNFNIEGIVQGRQIDSDLNEIGIKQRDLLCKQLKTCNLDHIYLSTLKRTYQTMSPLIDNGVPYQCIEDLDELNFGQIEGTPIFDAHGNSILKEILTGWKSGNLDLRFEGGESPLEALERVKKGLSSILMKENESTIAICLHQRILRIVMCYILNKPLTMMDDFPHHNTGVTTVDYNYQTNAFSLLVLDNTSHLK